MKKVLSLLASFGLVATSAMTVVACTTNDSNNPNTNLNEVKAWFNNAQPNKELEKEGQTMLIAIGGRYNSDTLSYLATLTQLVNNKPVVSNPNTILEQDNITNFEQSLGNYNLRNQPDAAKKNWQDPLRSMINAVSSAPDPSVDENQNSAIAKKYFFHDSNLPIEQMSFHTILVDKIENFWNIDLGKGIINEILGQQLKDFLNFIVEDKSVPTSIELDNLVNDQEKFDKFIKDKTKNLLNTLQGDNTKGPWFLVVRSGKIVGIKTGFRNYYEFNSEYKGAEDQRKNSVRTNNLSAQTWEEFSQSISNSLNTGIGWLTQNFLNTSKEVRTTDLVGQNVPNNSTNNSWTSKISGTSNIVDLDKPRGEEINEEEPEAETSSYHFTFLD